MVIAAAVVVILLASTVFYKVDELTDVVLIKTFGKVTDGPLQGPDDAGLHVKWPWPFQRLVRYDARVQVFEDIAVQYSTKEKSNIILSTYCTWQIADAVAFHTQVETFARAERRLNDLLREIKGGVVGDHEMRQLVNTDPNQMRLAQIERRILDSVRPQARSRFGVAVKRVGIKSVALPERIASAVIELQKQQQQERVDDLRSSGNALAQAIEERAAADSRTILAFARRKAEDIKTRGQAEAAALLKDFREDPELALFLWEIDSLRKQLAKNTVFILDSTIYSATRYFSTPTLQRLLEAVRAWRVTPTAADPNVPGPVSP
jgi:membrane protease subunit HflC